MTIHFEKICRTCMADNKILISIWSVEEQQSTNDAASIATMLKAIVHNEISLDDRLPKKMCLTCVSEMNQAFAFKQKCTRSETTLLSYLKQLEQNPTVDDIDAHKESQPISSMSWCGDEMESHEIEFTETEKSPLHVIQEEEVVVDSVQSEHIVYQCVNCSNEFETNAAVEQHMCTAHKIESLQTEQIPMKSAIKTDSVGDHRVEHDELLDGKVQKFICNHCNGTFTSQRSLTLHVNSKRCLEKSYDCDICQKVFAQKRYLVKHLERMHKKDEETSQNDVPGEDDSRKKYKCDVCSKRFTMMSSLKDHSRIHTGFRPFLCATCGKRFTQSANLRQHLMRHSQNKPFKCEKCSASFVSKGELITHDRTHTKDHPFVCEICNTKFTTSSSLGKHRRIHTGEKRYGCDLCPLRFTALNTLKNHRRTHTGEKPYQCSVCNKTFSQRSDCVSHLRIHKGGKTTMKCEHCHATFRRKTLLDDHLKNCRSDQEDVGIEDEVNPS